MTEPLRSSYSGSAPPAASPSPVVAGAGAGPAIGPARKAWRALRLRLLAIPEAEISVARRGFRCGPEARKRLEAVARRFLAGYHAALEAASVAALGRALEASPHRDRGYAFEGAAMALGLLDALAPWRPSQLRAFLDGPGRAHTYLIHVGAGWSLARLPLAPGRRLGALDPLLCWLAFDGCGFHDGYFHHRRTVERTLRLRRLRGYAARAYDQGLGRSLWFVEGAEAQGIARTVSRFPERRRGDLWSGVGLACAYTGGAPGAPEALVRLAGAFAPDVAQGAVFAAKARHLAGDLPGRTEEACRVLCGLSAEAAAALADRALAELPTDLPDGGPEPRYEAWRRRLRRELGAGLGRPGADLPGGMP